MANINFLNTVNFNGNETQNQVIHNLAANPTAANSELGQIYFNTSSNELRVCTNASTPTWTAVGTSYGFDAGADTGTDQPVNNGNLLDITANDVYLATAVSKAGSTVTVNVTHSLSGVSANTYAYPSSVTVNAAGHITSITAGSAPGTMSSFDVAGNGGTTQTIVNGETLSILGDNTYITTSAGATDTITINHATISQSDTTSSASPAYGASFDVIDTVSRNGAGHVTGVNVKTVTLPAASSWTITDGTTSQTIANGDTLTVTTPATGGLKGIDAVVSATDTLTLNLDLSELDTVTTIDPAADFLVGVDGTANEKILYQNVHLNQWGAAEGNVSLGSNKIINLADGTNANDAVNYGQLQAAVGGVGLFQGGYNASTNSPALTGASNVALNQGDFFVVTTGGTFYSDTVEVGDLIFANNAIAANSSPTAGNYTVVIADENIAGAGATDGATQKGVAGFFNGDFSVTANGFVTISDVTLGTQTTGNYTATVAESGATALLGIDVSGATGEGQAAVVGLDIKTQTELTSLAAADDFIVWDQSTDTNKRVGADVIASYVESAINKRDAYLVLNSATSGVSSTNNGTDTISWTLDLSVLDTNGVIDIGTNVNAVKVEVINVADAAIKKLFA